MTPPPSFRRVRPRGLTAGFTLVEMLAVTAIIGVLAALTVLGVRGVGGGASRKAAVGTLMSVFDQARMLAISDGRPTYVVFASTQKGQTQANAAALPDSIWGRAYALFEDNAITDATTATGLYPAQRSAWLYLPVGVAFKCDNSTDGSPDSVTAHCLLNNNDNDPNNPTNFQVQSRASGQPVVLTLPFVKFDAQGQVVDVNGDIVPANWSCLRVLLFQGIASSAGAETSVNRAVAGSGGIKYAVDEILLKPTTGRAQYTLNPVNGLAAGSTIQ